MSRLAWCACVGCVIAACVAATASAQDTRAAAHQPPAASADPAGAHRRAQPPQPAARSQPRSPKRVTLKAGEAQSTEQVSLKPGEAERFVIRGRIGQILMVDADSKDLDIKMIKGKDAAQSKEPGHYDSTLVANSDFVFQVKNTSKVEVRAALTILISDTGISKR